MPSGLISPRSRAATLADVGERSAFVARQRVGRPRRRRGDWRARGRRLIGVALTIVAVPAPVGAAGHWLTTTHRFAGTSVGGRGGSPLPPQHLPAGGAI